MDTDLFRKAREGDMAAMMAIIGSFNGLIYKQCHLYHLRGYDFEDLKQVCYTKVVESVYKLREEELETAPAYIIRSLHNALKFETRKILSRPPEDSLNIPTESGLEFMDLLVDENQNTETSVLLNLDKSNLKENFGRLSKKEKDLVSYYIWNPYGGLKEYAEKYNENYRKVRYQKDLALRKLKAGL
ncbi:hypothetical protein ABB02_01859 [Clostridiaceae bacterium JG1575]|nr:hypothetical protein ABB02_01859 [Clostridiaceae bacterium JG1575]